MTDYKPVMVHAFDILRKRDLADKQPFKARAYQTILTQLAQLDGPVHSYEDIQHFKGLGEKIEQKLREILATGQLQSAERANAAYPIEALTQFQNIYGVGPAKATELTQLGLRTIQELRTAVQKTPSLLNDKQRTGLKYYEPLLERIPRQEMEEHKDILLHYLPFHAEIVGSYRRGAADSGDIDVLLSIPPTFSPQQVKSELARIVSHLQEATYIIEVLALGEHKCMAICQRDETSTPRRLDLLMVPDAEYAYGLLYFTGSDRFNVAFRQHALQKGHTLNEKTLTPLKSAMQAPRMNEEKDIFTFLGLKYIPPEERVNEKQILPVQRRPKLAT